MIIDQTPLAGESAYLMDRYGRINLMDPGPPNTGGPPIPATELRKGVSPVLRQGMMLQVAGVDLQLEGRDLRPLFTWQGVPLIRLQVRKELFPGLFGDPYSVRVHTISGFEDLQRGRLRGCEAMEVDGVPTLVSVGQEDCRWDSVLYSLPHPVSLAAAAWDIPAVRFSHHAGFTYTLALSVWQQGAEAPDELALVEAVGPDQERCKKQLGPVAGEPLRKIIAYQIRFRARVNHDTALRERYHGATDAPSRGRPLLSAINLLEPVDSLFTLHSLREVALASTEYRLFETFDAPPTRFTCSLPIAASLGENESIEISVRPGFFTNVEARVRAIRLLRPPITDKVG